MKNEYFTTHSLNNDTTLNYVNEVKKLAADIGITIIEDSENDRVIATVGQEAIILRQGMHNLNGDYMPRWYEAQEDNLPERLVHYAITHQTAGKKKIRFAKRVFDKKYPAYFDKWMFDFSKGATPNGWVSIV